MAQTVKNFGVNLTTTGQTTAYTAPSAGTDLGAVVHGLFIANVDGTNSASVTVEVTDTSAAATYKLSYLTAVPPGQTMVYEKPINLEPGDVLKVTASDANRLHVWGSVLQLTS